MATGPFDLSRREFVAAGAAALVSMGARRLPRVELTAQQVIDRIRANAGVPWREKTADTFKAGDPQTIVTVVPIALSLKLSSTAETASKSTPAI